MTLTDTNTSTMANYLDYRHTLTKEKMKKYKADRMKQELSKCTSKPVINPNSLKIAKKLHKNPVERLFKRGLEKNNPVVLLHKQLKYDQENTFSPNINQQSRSLTRTVDDLYSWNDKKAGKLIMKKIQYDPLNHMQKVPI